MGASLNVLKHREKRQKTQLWRHTHTLVFFRNHRHLARTSAGRRALRVAHTWIPVLRRELKETRAVLHPDPAPQAVSNLGAWMCIHRYEGAWNSNTGNGFYGGLQMDWSFMRSYGSEFMARWGTADRWPVWAQLTAAQRAYSSGRGFGPWPNTARACGLL